MIFLSDSAIRYTVSVCQEKERYKAMIAVTNEMRNDVIDRILPLVESVKGARIINSSTEFKVMFDNASSIYVAPAYESTRGLRTHLLVVDEDISRTTIQNVLRPCEVMDWSEYLRKHRRDEE